MSYLHVATDFQAETVLFWTSVIIHIRLRKAKICRICPGSINSDHNNVATVQFVYWFASQEPATRRPEESYRVSVCVWSRNPNKGGQKSILDYKRLLMSDHKS
jgi:hypothetical protein